MPISLLSVAKYLGVVLACCAVIPVILVLFIWYGTYGDSVQQRVAAYDAVIDYANNKDTIGFTLRDTDTMIAKPADSESCPSESRFVVGFRSHPCWILEHPTSEKTYRWFVDLRHIDKAQRIGFDHKKREWVELEVNEYQVEKLPSSYPQLREK